MINFFGMINRVSADENSQLTVQKLVDSIKKIKASKN